MWPHKHCFLTVYLHMPPQTISSWLNMSKDCRYFAAYLLSAIINTNCLYMELWQLRKNISGATKKELMALMVFESTKFLTRYAEMSEPQDQPWAWPHLPIPAVTCRRVPHGGCLPPLTFAQASKCSIQVGY